MEAIIQQMLPLAIERLQRCAFRRSCFLGRDRAVSGRDVYSERKNGTKYQRSTPERFLTHVSNVISRNECDEESGISPAAIRT